MPDRFERGVFLQSPLAGRPDLRTESAATNAIAKDLGQLAERHGLLGCVLISMVDGRIGVNSTGEGGFARHMEQLGDRLLAAIDDGQFDPTEKKPGGPHA
jgi:hypothetical protein